MAIAHARPRVDPEDPLEIPLAPMIEWYRVDATRRIAILLAIGSIAMSVGVFAVVGLTLRGRRLVGES